MNVGLTLLGNLLFSVTDMWGGVNSSRAPIEFNKNVLEKLLTDDLKG